MLDSSSYWLDLYWLRVPSARSLHPSCRGEQDLSDLVFLGQIEGRLAIDVLHSEMFHRPVRGDELTDDVCPAVVRCQHQSDASTVWFL